MTVDIIKELTFIKDTSGITSEQVLISMKRINTTLTRAYARKLKRDQRF